MTEDVPAKKWHYVVIGIVSGFLSILMMLVDSQPSIGQSLVFLASSIIFLFLIFTLLMPGTNTSFIHHLKMKPRFSGLLIAIVMFFPLLNWIYSSDTYGALISYLLWYLLPSFLMALPLIAKNEKVKRFDFVFHIAAVLIYAAGFDMRFTYATLDGLDGMKYQLNALWISSLILFFLAIQLDDYGSKFNWQITRNKLKISILAVSILMIILIPVGFLTGFLTWNPALDPETILVGFLGIWLTIALPEEIVARGVVQHQLTERVFSKERKYWKWIVLILASIIFGSSHWNNTSEEFMWVYIIMASVAGIVYGIAWWFGGLFSAMLVHTLVDWIWSLFFKL